MDQGILPGFDEFGEVSRADGLSPEAAAQISGAAQAAFEGRRDVVWMDEYLTLRAEGWPWRIACYIAWATTPREGRQPGTLQDLASTLGLKSARAIHRWREKNPEIDRRVEEGLVAPLMDARQDVLDALIESASDADHKHHPDRKLFLEMTKLHTPRQEVDTTVRQAGIFLPEVEDESDDA